MIVFVQSKIIKSHRFRMFFGIENPIPKQLTLDLGVGGH